MFIVFREFRCYFVGMRSNIDKSYYLVDLVIDVVDIFVVSVEDKMFVDCEYI